MGLNLTPLLENLVDQPGSLHVAAERSGVEEVKSVGARKLPKLFLFSRHGSTLLYGGEKLGPNGLPVVGSQVATSELTIALLLDPGAVGNGNSVGAPLVDRSLRLAEPPCEGGLKALAVEKGCPVVHAQSMADPDCTRQWQSGRTIRLIRHDAGIPYAQTMSKKSFGFGARLKAAREAAGLTGTELGRGAGENGKDASKQSVADWEKERHYPKADQLRVICLKLNINLDDLIFGDIKEEVKVLHAVSAVQQLSEHQRMAFLAKMLGPTAPDERVGEFYRPAPKHELDSDFAGLDASPPPPEDDQT